MSRYEGSIGGLPAPRLVVMMYPLKRDYEWLANLVVNETIALGVTPQTLPT